VTVNFVDGMRRVGFGGLGIEDLIRLRDHGVTPAFAETARRNYDARTVSEIIRLRDSGVRE
jgi:hypothetical protein